MKVLSKTGTDFTFELTKALFSDNRKLSLASQELGKIKIVCGSITPLECETYLFSKEDDKWLPREEVIKKLFKPVINDDFLDLDKEIDEELKKILESETLDEDLKKLKAEMGLSNDEKPIAKANKYGLIDTFFIDQNDYITFLSNLKERTIANDDGTCFATLQKEKDNFIYKLTWLEDGKFIGDYIKPFKASAENIELFNEGCRVLAERLSIYIETNDLNLVPNDFPAFGKLTKM